MREIRLHGRGGQGVALAAEILAAALLLEGKQVNAFPVFGFERRGAPVAAFVRFAEQPIKQRTQIYQPDCVVITDPAFASRAAVFAGLKPMGMVVVNTRHEPVLPSSCAPRLVAMVDATGIALKAMGRPITNTCMLGAFARATQWVSRESLLRALVDYFQGASLQANMRCAELGYDHTTTVIRGSEVALR